MRYRRRSSCTEQLRTVGAWEPGPRHAGFGAAAGKVPRAPQAVPAAQLLDPILERMIAAAGPRDDEAAHARHEHDPLRGHQHTRGDTARHAAPAGAVVALGVRQHILHQNR